MGGDHIMITTIISVISTPTHHLTTIKCGMCTLLFTVYNCLQSTVDYMNNVSYLCTMRLLNIRYNMQLSLLLYKI